MKYVVYIKNDKKYEKSLKEIKEQMKTFLAKGDKVIYIRSEDETHISAVPSH